KPAKQMAPGVATPAAAQAGFRGRCGWGLVSSGPRATRQKCQPDAGNAPAPSHVKGYNTTSAGGVGHEILWARIAQRKKARNPPTGRNRVKARQASALSHPPSGQSPFLLASRRLRQAFANRTPISVAATRAPPMSAR